MRQTGSASGADAPTFASPKKRLVSVPGQLIVRVHEGAVQPHLAGARVQLSTAGASLLPDSVAEPLEYLRRNAGLKKVRPLFSTRRAAVERASVPSRDRHRLAVLSSVVDSPSEELAGIAVVSLPAKRVTPELVKTLKAAPTIDFVEPMPARWLAAAPADPRQNLQWGLRAIRWFEAGLPQAGEVRVGVLDTGIDAGHPDLQDVVALYDHPGTRAQDVLGHGTHVAGVIAASANNQAGVVGVAGCKLAVWKIFPDAPIQGDFYVDGERYLQALQSAAEAGLKVVNLSIGGPASSLTEALLFRRLEEAGVVACAAMGNEFQEGNATSYPAAYPGVLSVGAVAETRLRSPFSNTGRHIDLVAPGSNILSTVPTRRSSYRSETRYASWSGTSMATPHAAGAAALVAARHPTWTAAAIKERLRRTAARVPDMGSESWTPTYGAGLLDLRRALS